VTKASEMARDQARQVAQEIVDQGGPEGLENRKVTALIAYIQRLGVDITKPPPAESGEGESGVDGAEGGAPAEGGE